MSVQWTIKGEAGRTVDETERDLQSLQMRDVEIYFGCLAPDEIVWTIWLKRLGDPSTRIPEAGQRLTLYRNGDRYFTGHVIDRQPTISAGKYGYSMRLQGPWYWLSRISISSLVPDQAGDETERATYIFPTGTIRTHLISLGLRAITLGVPISIGSIASTFEVMRLSLPEMKFSEAFAEVMRLLADGHLYFDHSGPDDTYPALCMQRRTPASTITVDARVAGIDDFRVQPRYDLQVEELKVFYARRDTVANKRVTVFDSQSAGASTPGGLPRRQLVTITGPELDFFLPQDLTDSVVVRSAILKNSGQVKGDVFVQYEERLAAAGASDFGVGTFSREIIGGTYNLQALTTRITDAAGNDIDPSFTHYLTKGEIRDWWKKDGIEHVMARITATIYNVIIHPQSEAPPPFPEWYELMGGKQDILIIPDPGGFGEAGAMRVFSTTVSVAVPLVKTLWAADTTLIRQEDWGWFNPPAGFAENLLETQSFVPMEGTLPIVVDEIPAGNAVGSVLNISHFFPETADMRAMISGYTVRPATGEITYRLGAPERFAFRDLVNRFRRTGTDNIYYLNDYTPPVPGVPDGAVLNEDGTYELNEDGSYAIDES